MTADRIRVNRIFVREAVLTEALGPAYVDYAVRVKRLVPG